MKTIILFTGILFIINCSSPNKSDTKNEKNNIYGIIISTSTQEAVTSLQNMLKAYQNETSRSTTSPSFDALFRMDSTNVIQLPYYDLDTKAFYENPDPTNIIPNLTPAKDLYIALVENGIITASFRTHKIGEKWEMLGYTETRAKTLAWLPGKLKEADSKDYKIFRVGGSEFYVFTIKGETEFYNSLGETISGNKLCSTILQLLNQGKNWNEWLQKH